MVHVRERSSTRGTILAAARRIAERDGIGSISLSAVAGEAGFARAAVYGLFRSKEDLLHSVVADDLNVIAQIMRAAAGLPEPPAFKPPPSRIVRFDSAQVEEFRKESEARARDLAGAPSESGEDDVASAQEESAPVEAAEPVLLLEHRSFGKAAPVVAFGASDVVADVPTPAFDTVPVEEESASPDGVSADKPAPQHFEFPESLSDGVVADAAPEPSSEPNHSVPDAIEDVTRDHPVEEPAVAEQNFETSAEDVAESAAPAEEPMPVEEPAVATEAVELPAEEAAADAPDPPPEPIADAAPSAASSEGPVATEESSQEEPSESVKPLQTRLPGRGERIRLSGKRVLATPELRETMRRLSPAFSADGGAQAEKVAKLEEAVSKFDAGQSERLERRVHLLEGALADLTSKHEKSQQGHAATASALTESLGTVVKRIDESERRLRDSMARMMAEVRDAARRLDELDFSTRAEATRAELLAEPDPLDHEPSAAADDELGGAPPAEEAESENAPEGDDKDAYLSAARHSALTAALRAAEFAQVERARKMKLTRMLMIGVGGLAAVLMIAGVALNAIEHSATKASSVSITLRHGGQGVTRIHRVMRGASAAPLDRLSALANNGNADAEFLIGLRYLNGDGIAKNEPEGAKWIARAANGGNPVAQFSLGTLYQHARGVSADPAQAAAWYQKAALKGNRKAMHDLAVAYAEGTGVPKDFEQAARWFSQAANLGYVDSQFNLAVLYERGDGVPQSLLDAYKWYAIAAAQGDAESRKRTDAIATQLPADDLAAAASAAANFKPVEPSADANGSPNEALLLARY